MEEPFVATDQIEIQIEGIDNKDPNNVIPTENVSDISPNDMNEDIFEMGFGVWQSCCNLLCILQFMLWDQVYFTCWSFVWLLVGLMNDTDYFVEYLAIFLYALISGYFFYFKWKKMGFDLIQFRNLCIICAVIFSICTMIIILVGTGFGLYFWIKSVTCWYYVYSIAKHTKDTKWIKRSFFLGLTTFFVPLVIFLIYVFVLLDYF
eukprot:534026_1